MRKYIIMVHLLFVFTINLFAQNSSTFGLKAGINLATTNDAYASTIVGFIGGGFYNYQFTKIISIQPELLFTMKGENIEENVVDVGKITGYVRLNYIELPVLVKIDFLTSQTLQPNFFAGPYFSILTENSEQTDFGFAVGGGTDITLSGIKLFIDVRYSFSTKDIATITTFITDTTGSNIYTNSRTVKNRVISLMLGIKFL